MRIIYMRVLFFLVLIIMGGTAFPSVRVDGSQTIIDSSSASFSFSSMEAYLSLGPLSYGDISKEGLVATLSDPYRLRVSMLPRAMKPGRYESDSGFVLSLGSLSLLASTDSRPLLSISYDHEYFDAAILYAGSGVDERGFHDAADESALFKTLYFAAEGGWKYITLLGIGSFSPEIGYRGALGIGLKHEAYSLSFIYGSPIALTHDSDPSLWGIRGSFGGDGFYSEFRLSYGSAPVFSEDYLPRSSEIFSVLEAGAFRFYSRMEHSFSRNGNSVREDEFAISYGCLDAGYSTEDGFFISLDFGHFTIGFRRGAPFVAFSYAFSLGESRIDFSLSTDGDIDTSFRLM